VRVLWSNRKIIALTTIVEMKKRYAGSTLGSLWLAFYPMLLLSMYLFIYLAVFKVKVSGIGTSFEYSLFVLAGIVPYLGFAEAVNNATVALSANRHLISNVLIPMEIIPVRMVGVALLTQCISLAILAFLMICIGKLSLAWLFLPVALLMEIFFLIGLGYILACLGVILRDVVQVVAVGTLFLMFISPIGYTTEMVPDALRWVLYINPLWYIVDSFREPMLYGRLPCWENLSLYFMITVFFFVAGCLMFKRMLTVVVDLS